MRRAALRSLAALALAVPALVLLPPSASPADRHQDRHQDRHGLDVYTATVPADRAGDLAREGLDITDQRPAKGGLAVDLVLTADQRDKLRARGITVQLKRVQGGRTLRELAAEEAEDGFRVWRSYDEEGGIRDQIYAAARDNPQVARVVRLGTTGQGREILAVKVTQQAGHTKHGRRPAVLYISTQHAREWISTEVNRRLMMHVLDGWRARDPEVRQLLRTTELWFVLVANPDGYQYTFDTERLWRKNLRDNDGDGQVTTVDGVDPNRNYPSHWGYDEEGSSSLPASETYRGTAPASEPETRALMRLMERVPFRFQVNYHSHGQWLLYGEGWQTATPTADDPIYHALSGNLDRPAIPEFHPGLSSDVLYVTNGDTNDYAHASAGILAWTPELSEGCDGCGFVFPDDPELVEAEFQRNLPFAWSLARSADDPDDPESVLGVKTKPFYLRSDDPYKAGIPGANFTFDYSYGDPQPVAVLAKRSLGRVTLKYQINGGRVQSARTREWAGGERYEPPDVYYRQVRGVVRGTRPGDEVKVWFTAKGRTSESFTYRAVSESRRKVLVMAAEDYTGASPDQQPGPHHLDHYLRALRDHGMRADVYDVDARGREAPHHLGVLSHYDAVVWYTGDDVVTRPAGGAAGNADRLALDQLLHVRAYLNEGGRVLWTGDMAGEQFTGNVGTQLYDPKRETSCQPLPEGVDPRRCLPLGGSGDGTNDVLQYYFGAYLAVLGDGVAEDGTAADLVGIDSPFDGLTWTLNGGDSAANQQDTSSFVATSGILPVDQFKQFASWPSSRWDKPGGPFAPHTGSRYVYSQIADVAYKRLTREITVPATGSSTLTFWTSYDTEADWDHFFVEARSAGGDDWTTLPDANGHTTTAPGESCAQGGSWTTLHPQLTHYVTFDGTACTATGTTGAWHAASGSSNGWQQWSVDLSAWAGRTVEVSLTYATDWATQNLGVFVDDVTLPDGSTTSFEEGLDGWVVSEAPAGSAPNGNSWVRTDQSGFPVGASITTPDTVLMGFGVEGISTAAEREEVLGRAIDHLLR